MQGDKTVKYQHLLHPVYLLCILLAACTATRPAPVIERAPAPAKTAAAKPAMTEKDWRPNSYTVKKGDTLYSIGLEYGYDYKEIAQANNIVAPYIIYIGQQLSLKTPSSTGDKSTTDGDVIIRPLNMDPGSTKPAPTTSAPQASQPVSGALLVLNEPKAIKEPYSAQALTTTATPKPAAVVVAPPVIVDPPKTEVQKTEPVQEAPKADTTAGGDESINWGWPTTGKVVAQFTDASDGKGIDIAGTQGQAVIAAAAGKVIYSGSDLRGYGKLVIIKHNNTYLSVYAHNNQVLVKEGQQVSKGQKISEMGNTDADRVKLHFEIRRQGKSVDPEKYLPANP
ncbi:peptidase M23 [Methylovorus sp. MM2]|uniref:peptidoglycan DD-metalloendopeptidase family protein n=1 Tax=Methylovorus sp. MM2 TaxID=1848038 RepID=UPI0007E1CD6D|nr:peptidoglycan DD-metalloendopeptidase family protein [Methylovorus sp. MM2]OAM52667.1 peptidase M23 [Methylovorus sp. MM2]